MMNLLGCSKENFYKLMTYMNYKKDKSLDTYIFQGERKKREKLIKIDKKENPFNKLLYKLTFKARLVFLIFYKRTVIFIFVFLKKEYKLCLII